MIFDFYIEKLNFVTDARKSFNSSLKSIFDPKSMKKLVLVRVIDKSSEAVFDEFCFVTYFSRANWLIGLDPSEAFWMTRWPHVSDKKSIRFKVYSVGWNFWSFIVKCNTTPSISTHPDAYLTLLREEYHKFSCNVENADTILFEFSSNLHELLIKLTNQRQPISKPDFIKVLSLFTWYSTLDERLNYSLFTDFAMFN